MPDISSIFLTGAAVGGIGFFLLLRASATMREPWFLCWVAMCGLQALTALLNGLRPVIPPVPAIFGIIALQFVSLGLLWAGIRRLGNRSAPVWVVLAAPAVWATACLVPEFVTSTSLRLALFWIMAMCLGLASAAEAVRVHRNQAIRASLDLAVLLGFLSVVGVFRLFDSVRVPMAATTFAGAISHAILASAMPFLALSIAHERRRLADVARVAAAARLSSLGEMAAGMAHEVNTPLAIIGLAAENAADALEDDDAQARSYAVERLRLITETVQRGRAVIDHVRTFARGADGQSQAEPIALALVLEGAASLTQGALRPHGIALDARLPPETLTVAGGAVPLEQVFSNLILNAKDAILASGRKDGVIRIRVTSHRDCAEIEVEDNGGGIPDAVLPRIFEPFFSTKLPGQGTGLGLSIVHGTLRKLGGTVRANNGRDGACFTVTLPRAA